MLRNPKALKATILHVFKDWSWPKIFTGEIVCLKGIEKVKIQSSRLIISASSLNNISMVDDSKWGHQRKFDAYSSSKDDGKNKQPMLRKKEE